MFTAVTGAMGLAILAGCTSRQAGISASDQAARYLQSARGRYVVPGPPGDPWGPYVREASAKYDMPETWIRALMRQESGGSLYRNGRLITSSAGAMGLMQVMPGTYAELRARHNLGPDPFDPHDNIMAGVGYMREMYDIYGSPGFLAAYNAGPNRLDDYLANQRSLPEETRHYVAVIGPALRNAQPRVHSPAQQFAMNQLPLNIPPGPRYGYGTVQVPSVQMASATPAYTRPVFTQAAVQPAYTPAPQPRVVAWAPPPAPTYAAPAAPVYTPAPAPQPRALAWNEPPRPVYASPPAYAPPTYAPPRQTVVARAEVPDDYEPPARRHQSGARHAGTSRVALNIPRVNPQRGPGGLHFISSAMASEVYSVHRGRKVVMMPVSYGKPAQARTRTATTWKLHASGPLQVRPACHKNSRGKLVCGSDHI
jgi:hypothetical protein